MTPVEEVKSRLDIVDVINEYVPLKPAGANWRARCPFHDEKSASFMVSKPKQIWHCFGCGEGGDVLAFVMKQEGVEFPEALRMLAEKAGVKLRFEPLEKKSERDRLLRVITTTVELWGLILDTWTVGAPAKTYLQKERGLSDETIKTWKLGFAPDSWETLVLHLQKQGFSDDEMVKAGVGVKKMEGRGRSAYDRFRNRIMFPIADVQGRIVGATGRILPGATQGPNDQGKYVNTPETMLYHKGSVLYGLHQAKTEIRKQNLAVIVEGNMDVIASHQAGVTNVVAASGTALTDDQVSLLRRYTERLAFAFDADAAGEAATLKGLAAALAAGFTTLIITLPEGKNGQRYKDPDECVQENPEAWKKAIASAEPVIDHYLRRASEEKDMTKLEDKQSVVRILLPIIMRLPDRVAEAHYLALLATTVQVSEQYLRESMPKGVHGVSGMVTPKRPVSAQGPKDQHVMLSERFLSSLFHDPRQANFLFSRVPPEYISSSLEPLYRAIIVYYTQNTPKAGESWSEEGLREHLLRQPEGAAYLHQFDVLSLLADQEFSEVSQADFERDLLQQAKRLKKMYLRAAVQRLEQQIRNAERSDVASDRLSALMKEFQGLSGELVNLDNE